MKSAVVIFINAEFEDCPLNVYICTHKLRSFSSLGLEASFCREPRSVQRRIMGASSESKRLDV